jgi:3-oxoacyl-[acyl-carrier-protein] synthase II
VAALITACATRTCLGDGPATYAALLAGRSGVGPLRHVDAGRVGVTHAYQIPADGPEQPLRAGRWLSACVTDALAAAGVDPTRRRVVRLVGTGLRQLRAVETTTPVPAEDLHFGDDAGPGPVLTVANACSAAGHVLALAQDLVELGEADAVVVGAADTMTESMLGMIGRVTEVPADHVRPFDAERPGVLLGDGAGALVVEPDRRRADGPPALARLLATGLSCDAHHETAPDVDGIRRAADAAYERGGRTPDDVDLVVAHGTGTALNDPTEAAVLSGTVGSGPLVTAVKGAVGHTSGHAALFNVDVALRCLATGLVPPVVGLRTPMPEAAALRLVTGRPVRGEPRLAQVNAFGFGGVNAITLLEVVR